jgi:hypothetical protein
MSSLWHGYIIYTSEPLPYIFAILLIVYCWSLLQHPDSCIKKVQMMAYWPFKIELGKADIRFIN